MNLSFVGITGRVLTTDGNGLSKATVSITDSAGVTQTALTNSFGYYSFPEVGPATYVHLTSGESLPISR